MPSQKGFSVILIIVISVILIGSIAAVFYFVRGPATQQQPYTVASPDSSVTSYVVPEYYMYTHPAKGFTFDYPSKWTLKTTEEGDISGHSTDFSQNDKKMMNLTIIDSPLDSVKVTYPRATEISVDNKKGLKEGNKILIPLGSADSSVALMTFEDSQYIDHIISTFKFSEQTKIDDPEHWPVYEDKVNGFSFPYPSIFRIEPNSSGVKVFYDNSLASGFEPLIPPKLALEIIATKTTEIADVYAERIIKKRMVDLGLPDGPVITGDQVDFIPMYKTGIASKDSPYISVGNYFVNVNDSVIEIIAYFPNTETLKLNNMNILQYIVYKFKFKK